MITYFGIPTYVKKIFKTIPSNSRLSMANLTSCNVETTILLFVAFSLMTYIPSTAHALVQGSTYDTTIVDIRTDTGLTRDTLTVRIADTYKKRISGLRGTESLEPNTGMLFVYSNERTRVFTMRGMTFPLDIIFIGSDKKVNSIHPSYPEDDIAVRSKKPTQWILEANLGWTDENNIKVGDRLVNTKRQEIQ